MSGARVRRALVLAAAAAALSACGGGPPATDASTTTSAPPSTAAPSPATSPSASPSSAATSSSPAGSASPTAFTDATACASFGERGVESRLVDVYADDDASEALVQEYAGAPAFQDALRQTLELLRSSDGELEGDFLATACQDQPAG